MNRSTRIATCLIVVTAGGALGAIGIARPEAQTVVRAAAEPAFGDATGANITRLTSDILGRSQFSHHPLDRELAGKFLDGYLDALDGTHALFLQSDVSEFERYRDDLSRATRGQGDTTAARAIFARYLERLAQRTAYAGDVLQTTRFDFTGHDRYMLDRSHARRPVDLAAARDLWRQQLRAEYLQEKLGDLPKDQIIKKLTRRYVRQLDTMKTMATDEVLEVYLNALAHVYDPHSDYLGHEQMESLSISMNLSLFGIGASLESTDGYCTVRDVLPGGPAAKGGALKPGDRIVAVAQAGRGAVDVVDMPLSRTVELIRGPKGTPVTLTVLSAGAPESAAPRHIALVRDQVQLEDQRAKARVVDLPASDGRPPVRLGVLDIPEFYADMSDTGEGTQRSVTADVARLLTKLKAEKVQGIVVDLRRNGGGSLKEAISLTGLFIDSGPVVQTRAATGNIEVDADDDRSVLYDGPLVLLTSRFSASASEIMAGALKDYGRAVIVGDPSTFGKGTVQNILPLARIMDQGGLAHAYDPGALKVTIRKFYRPSGASTQLRGVASDIVLPSATDFSDVSEASLRDPLPWDAVPPTRYEHLGRVAPYLDALRTRSAERVAASKEFCDLRDDLGRAQRELATKSISLNEAERRMEQADAKVRASDREREEAAHPPQRPVVYEFTVDGASSRGLPPPSHFVAKSSARKDVGGASTAKANPASAARGIEDDVTLDESTRILADYATLAKGAKDDGFAGNVRRPGA
ncbi:MAG TPA: carboxy terminal-processing peptidase [Polyangiaceae bacterium]|jgi:carboxyl-terminal processing protease|nr:carboxy terminal-processing peptidase [Polyangiaceae bacterium]